MHIPGAAIQTLHHPLRYTTAQIDKAALIAHLLQRGTLILTEPPRR